MSTISTVTDRVDGEVLTAAKYNTDHGVHETNATNLNTGKVEISNYNTEHGPTGVHSADIVRDSINIATGDAVRFRVVTADSFIASRDAPATPDVDGMYGDTLIKAWGSISYSGGLPIATGDVNISSITDTGTGRATPNFAVNFSDTDHIVVLGPGDGATGNPTRAVQVASKATSGIEMILQNVDSLTNPTEVDGRWDFSITGKN